ncbi:MDR family MFS transporter [Streptomyces sp. NPDC101160]|uniref:MDR family MFS transporter n=1 Tax=Streptomyces sp. NPDC101160 TaxID=3366118 RepID=UPI00380B3BFE
MDQLTAEDPTRIGPYRLIARLGAGGMGLVYLGRSEAGRTVAVKVVQAEYAGNPEFRRRFAREVAAARLVGGAWTAAVLDADPEAAVPWVATQYIPGPDLHTVVAEDFGPLPEPSVRALANRLALALGAVHAAGLIHRDLKPSNVLVTVDGPRVIDFGIARAMDSLAGDSLHTRTGMLIGSPGFMSPEQVRGLELTPASDVFCLGAVLVYAATGRHLFGATDTGLNAHLFRVAEEEADLTGVPDSLVDLVRACLAKDPAARPTPREVAERTAGDLPAEWLPGSVLAQLGRHAAQLLDFAPAAPPGVPAQPDPRVALAQQPAPVPPLPAYAPTAPGYGGAAPYAPTAPGYGAPGFGAAAWQPQDAEPAYPRRWLALAVACLVTFLVPFEAAQLTMAMPTIQADLGLGTDGLTLLFRVYVLALAALLLLGGHLADLIGRKTTLVVGLGGFMVASGLGGSAVSEGMLIAARGLQGVSAALLTPAALSLVAAAFPDSRGRRAAFGVYAAVVGAGTLVGSSVGGTLLELASWRMAEYIGVPLAVVALVLVLNLAAERPAPGGGARLDLPGLLLGSLGLVALVYALDRIGTEGWTDILAVVLGVVGLALLVLFLWWQTRSANPLMTPRMVTDPRRAGSLLALMLLGVGTVIMYSALLFRLQAAYGYSPMMAGLFVLPAVVAQVVAATAVAPRLGQPAASGILIATGAATTALGIAFLVFFQTPDQYAGQLLPALLLVGSGTGLAFMPLYSVLTEGIARPQTGGAAAAAISAAQLGEAIGVAVLNAAVTARLAEARGDGGYPDMVLAANNTSLWWATGATLLAALVGGLTVRARTGSGEGATGPGRH